MINKKLKKSLENKANIFYAKIQQDMTNEIIRLAEAAENCPCGENTCDDCKQKKLEEAVYEAFGSCGLGHIKDLWHFTKPPVHKSKNEDFGRTYGMPVGPGTGPGVFESEHKYTFKVRPGDGFQIIDILENGKIIKSIGARTKKEFLSKAKAWLEQKKK